MKNKKDDSKKQVYAFGDDAEIQKLIAEREEWNKDGEMKLSELKRQAAILESKNKTFALEWWGSIEKRLKEMGRIDKHYNAIGKLGLEIDDKDKSIHMIDRSNDKSGVDGLLGFLKEKLGGEGIQVEVSGDEPALRIVKGTPSETVH